MLPFRILSVATYTAENVMHDIIRNESCTYRTIRTGSFQSLNPLGFAMYARCSDSTSCAVFCAAEYVAGRVSYDTAVRLLKMVVCDDDGRRSTAPDEDGAFVRKTLQLFHDVSSLPLLAEGFHNFDYRNMIIDPTGWV
jgi:hypothetical protein